MAYRDVRIPELRNRLAFRFDPDRDVIEVMIDRRLVEVRLGDYREPWQRGEESAPVTSGASGWRCGDNIK